MSRRHAHKRLMAVMSIVAALAVTVVAVPQASAAVTCGWEGPASRPLRSNRTVEGTWNLRSKPLVDSCTDTGWNVNQGDEVLVRAVEGNWAYVQVKKSIDGRTWRSAWVHKNALADGPSNCAWRGPGPDAVTVEADRGIQGTNWRIRKAPNAASCSSLDSWGRLSAGDNVIVRALEGDWAYVQIQRSINGRQWRSAWVHQDALDRPVNGDCSWQEPTFTLARNTTLTIPGGVQAGQFSRPDASCQTKVWHNGAPVQLLDAARVHVKAISGSYAYVKLRDHGWKSVWINLIDIGHNESINQFWNVGNGALAQGQTIEYDIQATSTHSPMFYNLPIDVNYAGGPGGMYLGIQSHADRRYVYTSAYRTSDDTAGAVLDWRSNGANCFERGDEPGIADVVGCDTNFTWQANTRYTLRWTVGARQGTGRWWHASIQGPGVGGVQMPSYLIETESTGNAVSVGRVTTFLEHITGFDNCVPPSSSVAAHFGKPRIAGRSLTVGSTGTTWCVNATIQNSSVISGGRVLRY